MIYPWHQSAWQNIVAHWQNMHHAWLLVGKQGIGKTAFALHFAQALLCEKNSMTHEPCGQCASCHLFLQGNHPDFYTLSPEATEAESSNTRRLPQIKIDAIRAILEPLNQSSVRNGRRVVLINPAQNMNIQAANALLKILEEPPKSVIFILVVHNKDQVLPTIKSRCRLFVLSAPTHEEAIHYLNNLGVDNAQNLLAFHGGAPLFVGQPEIDQLREQLLNWLAQPRLLAALDYSALFDKQKLPLANLLDWLQKWLIDVSLVQQNISPRYYPHHFGSLKNIAVKTNPATLFALLNHIKCLHPYGFHSLNVKMQAESLLTEYLTALSKKAV